MKYRTRIFYTEADKALMWDRWQKGDSLHAIARLFDRSHGSSILTMVIVPVLYATVFRLDANDAAAPTEVVTA